MRGRWGGGGLDHFASVGVGKQPDVPALSRSMKGFLYTSILLLHSLIRIFMYADSVLLLPYYLSVSDCIDCLAPTVAARLSIDSSDEEGTFVGLLWVFLGNFGFFRVF